MGSKQTLATTGRDSVISLSTISSFTVDTKLFTSEINEVVIPEEANKVLIPLDASAHSEACLIFYLRFLHKPGNTVHVVYVMEDYLNKQKSQEKEKEKETEDNVQPRKLLTCCNRKSSSMNKVVHEVRPSPGVLAELARTDQIKAHFMKAKVKSLFRTNGVHFYFHKVFDNDTPTAILKFASEKKVNMIIMGSRGLGAIKRRVLGGVSTRVINQSSIPVLVVNSQGIVAKNLKGKRKSDEAKPLLRELHWLLLNSECDRRSCVLFSRDIKTLIAIKK